MKRIFLHSKDNKGFTIIETLVAITVLMIAVAGPLSVAGKGLTAALTARDQMIASFLAQESMEVIKNLRNNNIAYFSIDDWLNGPAGSTINTLSNCTKNSTCDASLLDGLKPCGSQCAIYLETDGYGNSGGDATIYTRRFYLSDPSSSLDAQCVPSTFKECRVTVLVDWNEGTLQNEVKLTSELTGVLLPTS